MIYEFVKSKYMREIGVARVLVSFRAYVRGGWKTKRPSTVLAKLTSRSQDHCLDTFIILFLRWLFIQRFNTSL